MLTQKELGGRAQGPFKEQKPMKTPSAQGTRLYCFSPLVMAATFIIEIACALYLLWRYRLTRAAQLMTAILFCLATFQLAEYMVCGTALGISGLDWARIGYVAITLLPPLGLHLGLTIAGHQNKALIAFAYGSAVTFSAIFLFSGYGVQTEQCLGNYVIFSTTPWTVLPYAAYYYGWLLGGLVVFYRLQKKARPNARKALRWLSAGYASFIVPTTVANIIDPATIAGIPSIMCGFAVLLALVLIMRVAPLALSPHATTRRSLFRFS